MRRLLLPIVVGLLLVSVLFPNVPLSFPSRAVSDVTAGLSKDVWTPLVANGLARLGGANVGEALAAKLDGLIGATGLDPLDPVHPLIAYEIEHIEMGPFDAAAGTVRMIYADGSFRRYQIPVLQSSQSWGRPGGWAYTGLDRFFAPHQELPHLPLAGADAAVQLAAPERRPLSHEAHRLGATSRFGWHTSSSRLGEEAAWSPAGDAFLLGVEPAAANGRAERELWLVTLDGRLPVKVASGAEHYGWSVDGLSIIFLRPGQRAAGTGMAGWDIVQVDRAGQHERILAWTNRRSRPTVVGDGIFFARDRDLWRVSLTGDAPAIQLAALAGLDPEPYRELSFAVAPDGGRVAYRCGDALCLMDVDGKNPVQIGLGAPPRSPTPMPAAAPAPVPTAPPASGKPTGPTPQRPLFAQLVLAWNPAGEQVVAIASDYDASMPVLWAVGRDGSVRQQIVLGPNGQTRAPQWTPDGRWLVVTTFPEGGRRIVAVDVTAGSALDLSQPGWDAFASLSPDGQQLLLWNGRGGFWTSAISFR